MSVIPVSIAAVPPLAHARFCLRHPGQCVPIRAAKTRPTFPKKQFDELQRINLLVNHSIEPQADGLDRGIADRWSLGGARGDCEDYALLKRKKLLDLGWSSSDLRIATALTPAGVGHAVLVVRHEGHDLVLDNKTGAIQPWDRTGYYYLKIQSRSNPQFWQAVSPHHQTVGSNT
jgi:predicted transglutaminase-like cysteine proteinase